MTRTPDTPLELPHAFRPYTPPGETPITIPNRLPPFRPFFDGDKTTRALTALLFPPPQATNQAENTDSDPQPAQGNTQQTHVEADTVFALDDDGVAYYLNLTPDKKQGQYRAVDENGEEITTADGKPIICNQDGYRITPGLMGKLKNLAGNHDNRQEKDEAPIVYTADGIPIGEFDVVAPGGHTSTSRAARGGKILTLTCATLAVVGGLALGAGVLWGRSAVPAQGQISPAEADTYHLSSYPTAAAAAFGEHYLTLCLTHPQYTTDIDVRNKMMAGMEAPGVPANCGWDKGGNVVAPTSVTFTGEVEQRTEYTNRQVAYLGFFVTMSDNRAFTATVPVWAGQNTQGRDGFAIVGSVGLSAATGLADEVNMQTQFIADQSLVGTVSPVLETFFTAWSASDTKALDAVTSADATGDVTVGMDKTMTDPQLTSVVVYPDKRPDKTSGDQATFTYQEGDKVTAMVNLDWHINDGGVGFTQPSGYRVHMVYHSGKWEVSGLQPGVVVSGQATGGSSSDRKNPTGNLGGGMVGDTLKSQKPADTAPPEK